MDELDPQVKVLLEQLSAGASQQSAPALSMKEKIAAIRQRMGALAAFGFPSEPVSKVSDLDIPGPYGQIPVRLYVPNTGQAITTPVAVLIYYHGGGFVAGDLESHDTLLRALANRGRCLVVSVAYRGARQPRRDRHSKNGPKRSRSPRRLIRTRLRLRAMSAVRSLSA